MTEFAYRDYLHLLRTIRSTGRLTDFRSVLNDQPDRYVVLRHDVDFTIERAYRLAKIEHDEGVQSSYFIMVDSEFYNAFSPRHTALLREMAAMGHHVGLHYQSPEGEHGDEAILNDIQYKLQLLSGITGRPADRFSYHRPSRADLTRALDADIVNAYAPAFFTYYAGEAPAGPLNVKYISDSMGQWNFTQPFTRPDEAFFAAHERVQILAHPCWWTQEGLAVKANVRTLVEDARQSTIQNLAGQTKMIGAFKDEL